MFLRDSSWSEESDIRRMPIEEPKEQFEVFFNECGIHRTKEKGNVSLAWDTGNELSFLQLS